MQYWWVPIIFLIYSIIGILSKNVSDTGKYEKTFFWLIFFGILSPILWAVVSVISKRLVLDSLIFQLFALSGLYIAMLFMGAGSGFGWVHWLGFVLAIVGIGLISLFPVS